MFCGIAGDVSEAGQESRQVGPQGLWDGNDGRRGAQHRFGQIKNNIEFFSNCFFFQDCLPLRSRPTERLVSR